MNKHTQEKLTLSVNRGQRACLVCAAMALAFSAAPAASAPFNIAPVPLYLGGTLEPNILFVLDDSGSMQWEAMPDEIQNGTNYLFPMPNNLYGGSTYDKRIPSFEDTNGYNLRLRSSHTNTTFYNPAIVYSPWVESDGTAMPQANATAVYYNPTIAGLGTYNLTVQQTFNRWRRRSATGVWSNENNTNRNYWPITFYVYKGAGDTWQPANYIKYQIRGANGYRQDLAGGPETIVSSFSWVNADGDTITRTVAQERQNFANWFQYYRSRILASRAGIGIAFAAQPEGTMRVGFGTINRGATMIDGVSTGTVRMGLRLFEGSDRIDFFDDLYDVTIPQANTPLRRALDHAGRYFERTDARGPWSTTPGYAGGTDLSCRLSYTILMTDGYWTNDTASQASTSAARANVDGSGGPSHTGPDSAAFTYVATSPFTDSHSNTLADVAMYYWKSDLRPDLENRVPTSSINPAFWQHMVTIGVGLGVSGTVDKDDAFAAIGSGAAVTWPNPTSSNAGRIDDLLHASVNGRGDFHSAQNPDEFAKAMSDTLATIGDRQGSATALAANSTSVEGDTLLYQAKYDSGDWTGQFVAYGFDLATGKLNATPSWDAANLIPAHGSRKIFTWRPDMNAGAEFTWAGLSAAQQTILSDGTTDTPPDALVRYLRGDSSNEGVAGLGYRARNSRLGDIVNSNPAFVGTQSLNFGNATILTSTQRTSYINRLSSVAYQNRPTMAYVGANDGMLHAFDAATGVERFAFVPNSIIAKLPDLADPAYTHDFLVDGPVAHGEALFGSAWRSVIVGSTGAGGRSYFALDVESPAAFSASDVLWEFTHAELGYTLRDASIGITESRDWVAIFGNGVNSDSHRAQLFVVDVRTGALLRKIDTEVGSVTSPNGLISTYAVDSDRNGAIDLVYAGDMQGNLWKFDLSGANATDWEIAYESAGGDPRPLFKATAPGGDPQPIMAKPVAVKHPTRGLMIYFGTGQFFETGDQGRMDVNSLYGVIDECVTNTSGACGSAAGVAKLVKSDLQQQQIVYEWYDVDFENEDGDEFPNDVRIVSKNPVDSAAFGFYLDLVSPVFGPQGERIMANARPFLDRVRFVSAIPDEDPCSYGGSSWIMELSPFSGGRTEFTVFDLNQDGKFDDQEYVALPVTGEGVPVSGRRHPGGMIFDSGLVIGDQIITGDTSGGITFDNLLDRTRGRESWRQIR